MPQPRLSGVFGRVALRSMQDALYERLIDESWEELREVFPYGRWWIFLPGRAVVD